MKELEQKTKDEVVDIAEKPIEKQLKFLGSLRPRAGHKLFQLDTATNIISLAEFKVESVNFEDAAKGVISTKKSVITKLGCLYTSALNAKNADRKFIKMLTNAG